MLTDRRLLAVLSLALVSFAPIVISTSPASGARPPRDQAAAVSTLFDWQLITFRTVYTENATPVAVGTLHVGFTSLAVHDAVQLAVQRGRSSARAAVATAAHDVLVHYFPNSEANLDKDLADTLAAVPNNPAEAKGIRLGHKAAADFLASRVGDGLGDTSISYTLDPTTPGIWAPAPVAGGMVGAWLGYVDPLIVPTHVQVDGPDPLDSAAYAAEFNEVKADGSLAWTDTTRQQVADFFYANSSVAYERALITYLRDHPMSLQRTARMFAVMNGSMADAVRTLWKLKREVGFWRPSEAIQRAGEDGNAATEADPTWQPYRANPPYSDYASGHAGVTSTFAETVRMYLGNDIPLTLISGPVPPPRPIPDPRSYTSLTALEHDAFHARIWAGIHFRDAMDDGYFIGHETARRAEALLR